MSRFPQLERVNVGAWITSVSVVVTVCEPEVPVMVTVYVPTAAELAAVKVKLLLPVVGLVPKDAVTPAGSPDAVRVTCPVNPYCGFT